VGERRGEMKDPAVKMILDAFNTLSDEDFKSFMLNNYDDLIYISNRNNTNIYMQGKIDALKELYFKANETDK
jgi:hypothetical protein